MNLAKRIASTKSYKNISRFIDNFCINKREHTHVVLFKHVDKNKARQFLLDFNRIFIQSPLKNKLGILSFTAYEAFIEEKHSNIAEPNKPTKKTITLKKTINLCFIMVCKTPPSGDEEKYYLESPEHKAFINNYVFKKGCILEDAVDTSTDALERLSEHNKHAYDTAIKRLRLNLQVGDYQGHIVNQLKQLTSDPKQSFRLILSRSRLPWRINLFPTHESAKGLHHNKNQLRISSSKHQEFVRTRRLWLRKIYKKYHTNAQSIALIRWQNAPDLP